MWKSTEAFWTRLASKYGIPYAYLENTQWNEEWIPTTSRLCSECVDFDHPEVPTSYLAWTWTTASMKECLRRLWVLPRDSPSVPGRIVVMWDGHSNSPWVKPMGWAVLGDQACALKPDLQSMPLGDLPLGTGWSPTGCGWDMLGLCWQRCKELLTSPAEETALAAACLDFWQAGFNVHGVFGWSTLGNTSVISSTRATFLRRDLVHPQRLTSCDQGPRLLQAQQLDSTICSRKLCRKPDLRETTLWWH